MCQIENKSNKSSRGVAMCHHLRGLRSKVLDNWIRKIQKEQMMCLHVAMGSSHLTLEHTSGEGEKERGKEGERREKKK